LARMFTPREIVLYVMEQVFVRFARVKDTLALLLFNIQIRSIIICVQIVEGMVQILIIQESMGNLEMESAQCAMVPEMLLAGHIQRPQAPRGQNNLAHC